jgi:YVTN family beta-propeller protein
MVPHHLSRSVRRALALAASAFVSIAGLPAWGADASRGIAYVSNQNGDVSTIDLSTMEISGTVSAYGKEPRGIGVTADGKLLVLANREGGRIAVIDRASGKLLRHIAIGSNPEFVRTRGHLAFVSYEPGSSGQAPGAAPGAASAPPSADKESDAPAHVAVVDLDHGRILRSIRGGLETEGIEFAADGRHIIIANEADNNLSVHEIATGKLVKTIDVKAYGNRPRGIKRAPDGKSYVATLELSDTFIVLDPAYRVIKSVKTGGSPYGVSFDRTGARLFVAVARSKELQVFDAKTWEPIKSVATGTRCWHFSFTPDDKNLLVACGRSNEIVVVDAEKLEVAKRIPDPQLPWGVVTYPKSFGSLDQPE